MRTVPRRLPWRGNPARTVTDELLEEAERQGHEDDTGTAEDDGGGAGDPITPSLHANRKAAGGRRSDGAC
ncbi:hypothetical protein ACFSL4_00595 [Streptomyces caeni]|uniref:Uncharacterized protein n=1 Tax=Streptomyces caeni TaxID=2307231 RepID=A0ABW4IJS2_9ACTN